MLRAVLLGCPVVLVFAVSCSGSDSASFTKGGPATSGTASSESGASAGGTASQGGSNAVAGSDATAGKANTAGSANMAGNQSTGGKGGTGSSGGSGNTAGNQTGGKGGSGNAGTANAGGAAGTTSLGGAAGAAGDSGGPLCPDLVGSYTITNVDGGFNCNGLNKNATQSIAATDIACRVHFVSEGASLNANVGVNGAAGLDQNGDFTGATLMFNKTSRSPCSGVWDTGNARLTIKCGGQGDLCIAELERN